MSDKISISNWKRLAHGALKGVFDVELPNGMILCECSLFEKDGKHWVSAPQKQFRVGEATKYKPAVRFVDRTNANKFNDSVLRAIRDTCPEVLG
jgi:hypothetical protein